MQHYLYYIAHLLYGQLAMYEWCWTQALNPHDVDHCRLAELIEASTQIGHRPVAERSFSCAVSALESSRLQIICQEDLASRGGVAYIPWYSFLDSAVRNSAILWPLQIGGDGVFGGLTKNAAGVVASRASAGMFKITLNCDISSLTPLSAIHTYGNVRCETIVVTYTYPSCNIRLNTGLCSRVER